MRRLHRGNTGKHRRLVRYIEWFSPENCLRSRKLFREDIDDNDLASLLGKQRGGRRADAAAAAGDKSNIVRTHRISNSVRSTHLSILPYIAR
jgi:hypothetical protein